MILLKTTYTAIAFSLCVLLLLPSCSNETEIGGRHHYIGEKVSLSIQMETRDVTDPDLEIDGVRAIVFNGDGELVFNGTPDPAAGSTDGSRVVKVKAAPGTNHIYIICNETTELTGKLDGIATQSDIEDITFNAVGITGAPPMYGKVEDAFVKARSDGSQATVTVGGITSAELGIKVTRLVARIGFTAIKNVDTSTQEDFKVTKISIKVCHMPKQTTIGEGRYYTADEWSDELSIEQTGLLDNNGAYEIDKTNEFGHYTYTVPDGINSIVLPDTYIPEHLLADKTNASRATYLRIEAECQMKDESTQVLRGIYLLNIGQNSSANYNLERNNYYHIYATITGLGAQGIYAEVVEMEEHDITINWKPIDGLVIVSDKQADYNTDGTSKEINVWDDYNVYSGILKTYHTETGYKDVVFKYGSLIAVSNIQGTSAGTGFTPPKSGAELGDILWYPASYAVTSITAWATVPYRTAGNIPADNSVEEVAKALGDPCKLVGLSEIQIRDGRMFDNKLWHMATYEEYQILNNAQDNEVRTGGYGTFHYLLLPYMNYRDESGQTAGDTDKGQFWTTRATSAFIVDGSFGSFDESRNAQHGYTVRCVRNTIPESKITVDRIISVDYQGNENGLGAPFSIGSNVPYWKAELVTTGTNNDNDFSFTSGATSEHTAYGKFAQNIPVYIKRWESQSQRNFRVKVEGTGLDGKTVSQEFTISQSGYRYTASTTFAPAISGYIPQAGETYSITMKINPSDVNVPAGELMIQAVYQDAEIARSNRVSLVDNQHEYFGLSITIPENNAPDIIGLNLIIYVMQENKAILQLSKISVLQNKK